MDIYNLINSKAIQEHCRKIGHKFNTEELTVLIYRNKKMSVEDKINEFRDIYKDFKEVQKLIEKEIKEDTEDNIISFCITKRTLSKKYTIRAEYILDENRKLKMVNISNLKSEWLDISNICLNIPTPFKKQRFINF